MPDAVIAFASGNYDPSAGAVGRRFATQGFLTGYLRHSGARHFTCLAPGPADIAAFRAIVQEEGGLAAEGLSMADLSRIEPVGTLYTPGPDLSRFAWARRTVGQRAFSLVGVTHTLSDAAAVQAIAALLTAPTQSWDALVCPTRVLKEAVARLMEEYGDYLASLTGAPLPYRTRLPVIPLGIHCDSFVETAGEGAAFRARHGIPAEDVVLLYLGRLDHAEKANPMPLYLAAQHAAAETGRRVHLLEAGWFRSPLFAEGFQQAAALLAPGVNRLLLDGRLPENRRAWFAADIFVSLSDNIQESFGLTPIEAMAAGVPVVVSDWNGYRESVRDGIDGLCVPSLTPPPGSGAALAFAYAAGLANHTQFCAAASQSSAIDPSACAQALIRLIEDPALRRRMGEAGRRRARELYDWRVVIAAYQSLWEELAVERRDAKETAPLMPGRPAMPLEMDPFDLFRAWPSATLDRDTILTLAPGVDALLVRAMGQLEIAVPVPEMLLDPAATEALATTLLSGPAKAGALVDGLPPELGPAAWRTLAWLAKAGLVRWG